MATAKIWPGSGSFSTYSSSYVNGAKSLPPTPFGFYDNDFEFQEDADGVAIFASTKLGYPLVDVELQDINFWTCFEEAVTTYGAQIYNYQIRSNFYDILGANTGSNLNNSLVTSNLDYIIKIAKTYGTEAGSGGNVDWKEGYIEISSGVQDYDLNVLWADVSESSKAIEIKKIHHYPTPAISKYFDPYAGTGTGLQSLLSAFGFGNYSPGINFMLMPVNYDILKTQAIEFNDQVRKSQYSFELINNKLKLFPIPTYNTTLYFQYLLIEDRSNSSINTNPGVITNPSNVPYNNPIYSQINGPGRDWIKRYASALSKEMLAYIRGKYNNSVPSPGDELQLNSGDLLSDARSEKSQLLEELQSILEATDKTNQMERKAQEAENHQSIINKIPLNIYVK